MYCALIITKCMRAEIKGDEKLLIDLEWSNLENIYYFHRTKSRAMATRAVLYNCSTKLSKPGS